MKVVSICFKEVIKCGGKLLKFVKKWYFFGLFVIGKVEVDGDFLEEWGGVKNVLR